jgi:multicomponent Na+:H+ antiporter subunit G
MTTIEGIVLILATIGVFFLFVSAVGLLRFRGVHARMQSAGIGGTVGIMTLLFSAGLYYFDSQELWRMLVLIALFAGTGPIATTAMARAAYRKAEDINRFVAMDEMTGAGYMPDYSKRVVLPADSDHLAIRAEE